MAVRLSTKLRNFINQDGSFKDAFQNGSLEIYSGSQPATADAAVTGTLLSTITKASGALTAEVLATGTVTLTGGAAGSVDTVTVDSVNIIPQGAVPFNTSLTQTAADLATAINQGLSSPEYRASSSGAVVTITALPGTGVGANGFVVTGTLTTITATYANMASGVAPVNGLRWGNAGSGVIDKLAGDTWSGVNVASGTAGWFRLKGSIADAGAADAGPTYLRLDGSVGLSGAEYNVSSTAFASGATHTISSFPVTLPANL
jgi:hypothetical protein